MATPAAGATTARAPSIVERVATVAAHDPTRPAAIGERVEWTYAEVHEESVRVARELLAAGGGDRVVVMGERTPALVPALLGAWWAGRAVTVLDPAHPPGWHRRVLDALEPVAALSAGDTSALPEHLRRWLAAQGEAATIRVRSEPDAGRASQPRQLPAPDLDRPATVMFTSGSAGRPRGVVASQRPLTHFLDWYERRFSVSRDDRFALLCGLAHDPVLRDLLAPLWLGARLVVPEGAVAADPERLADWLRARDITVCHLGPAQARALASAIVRPGPHGRRALPSLRHLFLHGDAVRRRDVEDAATWAPSARCVTFYGATETPQAVAWHDASTPPPVHDSDPLPLGRPVDDFRLSIHDAAGRPLPDGTEGEVRVRGRFLALGYLGDDALTGARFADVAGQDGEREYRTGDLGVRRTDGTVEFRGRGDREVKVRGFRVALGDVEQAMLRCPDVHDAAVLSHRGEDGEIALVAFACSSDPDVVKRLRRQLADELPAKCVPSRIVALDRLPTTPNGKVDTAHLRALDGT
jgi:amino acid adenylation domain-containing protein